MKAFKIVIGFSLIVIFGYLLMLVFQSEEKEYFEGLNSSVETIDSIQPPIVNTIEVDSISMDQSLIFDFKGVVNGNKFEVYQLENKLSERKLSFYGFEKIISSDLNLDENPEFWLQFQLNNQYKYLGFQLEKGKLITLNFPSIRGRQQVGYIGNDSLYLEKGLLVREFQFKNDPFAEMSNGFRKCYYAFGKDKSFVLKKTLDYEK
jgi:hypothetical protein